MTACLWDATAAEPAVPAPPLAGDARADVAVVGAGLVGLSAALHLAGQGASVTVLDAGEPGSGASGRSGGQVIPGAKLDPDEAIAAFGPDAGGRFIRLVAGAADETFALIRRHAIDCAPTQAGWIQPAYNSRGLALAERRVAAWSRQGADVALLDRAEVAALTGSPIYCGGWIDRRGGTLQPLDYTRGLARAARGAGARLHGGTRVQALSRAGGRWQLRTPGGTVSADHAILATNAYADRLWPGLKQSVLPVFSMQVATAPLGSNVRRTILPEGRSASDTRRVMFYYRLDAAGRLVMGGRGPFTDAPGPAAAARLYAAVREIFPHLQIPEYPFRWAGRIAMTRDHLPHLHELAPGLLAATGCNGRGVALGTVFGRVLAQWVGGAAPAELGYPVTPLRPLRLHAFSPVGVRAGIAGLRLLDRWEGRSA